MSKIFEFPLVGGVDTSADRVLVPPEKLVLAQNVRMTRDGRLEARPQYTALSSTTYSASSLVPLDLANYDGRLVCLGDQIAAGSAGATDLFEFVSSPVAGWRGSLNSSSFLARLPEVTAVRRVGATPDQKAQAISVRLATNGTYICAVTTLNDTPSTTTVHVFDPRTDQTILLTQTPGSDSHVVFQGTDFWIVTYNGTDVLYTRFKPGTDKTLQAGGTIAAGGTVTGIATSTLGSNWAVVAALGGSGAAFFTRSGTTGAAVASWTRATITNRVALVGNAAGTLLSVVYHPSTYSIETFNAAGATQNGPTALFGGAGLGALRTPGACLNANGTGIQVVASLPNAVASSVRDTCFQVVTQATHVLSAESRYGDTQNDAEPVLSSNGAIYVGACNNGAGLALSGSNQLLAVDALLPMAFTDGTLSGNVGPNGSCAIGSKIYWGTIIQSENNGLARGPSRRPAIYEAETANRARRQMTAAANELHIAGGLPLVYDGRSVAEQGFAEQPQILTVTQGAVGSISLLGVYNLVASWDVFDAKDNQLFSAVSVPRAVTMTGANNSLTTVVTTPHSLRCALNLATEGGLTVRVSIWRTVANDSTFFLDATTTVPLSAILGTPISLASTQSDVQLSDNAVVYTQSQTPIPNFSPGPYQYSWASRERVVIGGLPRAEMWAASKLLFPAEPITWASANQLGFGSRASRQITGIGTFDTSHIVWTADEIASVGGHGPERNGVGDFDSALTIASPGGCKRWQSLVLTPIGFFFQMTDEQLMLLGRGGEVTFVGEPIQDILAAYPVIAGAVHVRGQQSVFFACNNSANTDGVLLIYDLARQAWFVDTIGVPILSVSELDGRLAYISGTQVFYEDASVGLGVGALPAMRIQTGSFRFFTGLGYGDIIKIGLLGTYLGDCTVEGFISYDDGKTWTQSMGAFAVTSANMFNPQTGNALAANDPVTLLFTPARRTVDRFALRFDVTNATNTGGMRAHMLSFEIESQEFSTRQGARSQK